jgi:hypothetical protein
MEPAFNALEFVDKLEQGTFDGRVNEVLLKLSQEQLQSVALLLAQRVNGNNTDQI